MRLSTMRAAMKRLRDPDLAKWVQNAVELAGHHGERDNALLLYLVMLSRRLEKPLSACVLSPFSSGKSSLLEAVRKLQGPSEVDQLTDLTERALFYLPETSLKHKAVIVAEGCGSKKAAPALRVLMTEHFLRSRIVRGGKPFELYLEGPIAYIESTTKRPEPELASRMLLLKSDVGIYQTGRVHEAILRKACDEPGHLDNNEVELVQAVQSLLPRRARVQIPFAHRIQFPKGILATRRELDKFISLIQASALLHYHSRRSRNEGKGKRVIEATTADFHLAVRLFEPLLTDYLQDLFTEEETDILGRLTEIFESQPTFKRSEMVRISGLYLKKVERVLNRFEQSNLITRVAGSKGKEVVYAAGPALEELNQKIHLSAQALSINEGETNETSSRSIA